MTRPLTIELHGTGVDNRGAQLMAIAAAEHVRAAHPSCRIVVPPEYGSLRAIHAAGFSLINDFGRHRLNRAYMALMPPNLRRKFDLVDPGEIDVVLDASGFSFSDQWGPESAAQLADKMSQPARRNQPLILLPQAFGPFSSRPVADATRRLLRRASLVCARDGESLRYLQGLGEHSNLHLFPDFTLLVCPHEGELELPPQPYVAIVPNARMLDKTFSGNSYLQFLSSLPRLIANRGFSPLVVLHDTHEDAKVIDQAGVAFHGVARVSHPDPRTLKWALGSASFVIGSRFHAIASALAQGVPCIGTGWSHKYLELFGDFGCSDALLRDCADTEEFTELLDEFSDPARRLARRRSIDTHSRILRAGVEEMWRLVDEIVGAQAELRHPQ